MRRSRQLAVGLTAAVLVGAVAAGCGGDDDSGDDAAATEETAPPETSAGADGSSEPAPTGEEATGTTTAPDASEEEAVVSRVEVTLGAPDEFSLVPSVESIPAGEAVFTAVNEGQVEHELVMIKTDKDAANLAPEDIVHGEERNRVNEHPEHQAPGETLRFEADLEPGHYVLICNVPGHYQAGQYANFTVTRRSS